MSQKEIGVELGVSNVQRTPCVLVLDTSGSMATDDKIGSLNKGLELLEKTVKSTPLLRRQLMLAVVRFSEDAEVVSDWIEGANFTAPQLEAKGRTAMGKGMAAAYELVNRIRADLKSRAIPYTRPWVFLLSDGSPTDEWAGVAAESRRHCVEKRAVVWPFLVGDGDGDSAATLHQFAREDMSVYQLEATKFASIFEWLGTSLGAVADSGNDPHAQIGPPPATALAVSTH
jgi:uncharacterized protein YegL